MIGYINDIDMQNFVYKLMVWLYFFSVFFYGIFVTIFPITSFTTKSDILLQEFDRKSYYSALTSNEVKALSTKLIRDVKYRAIVNFKYNRIFVHFTITKEGRILGCNKVKYVCIFRPTIKGIFNTKVHNNMQSQYLKFDVFKVIFN